VRIETCLKIVTEALFSNTIFLENHMFQILNNAPIKITPQDLLIYGIKSKVKKV
jgi:hypothetical protein